MTEPGPIPARWRPPLAPPNPGSLSSPATRRWNTEPLNIWKARSMSASGAEVPVVPSLFEELAPVGQAGGDHPRPVQLKGVGVVAIGHESTEHPHARGSEPAVELDQESAQVGLGVARRSGRDLRRVLGDGAGDRSALSRYRR